MRILTATLLAATAWGQQPIHRLDRLAELRDSVRIGAVSSYDRTGGNDDGFSGKHSFLRKEDGALVIADLTGPGVIYRIWTPTPTDDPVEFYFDGETAPRLRLKFSALFDGSRQPFTQPLAGSGAGGYYSYVPLGYQKSCKVVFRGEKLQFYQINYAQYAADAAIETYRHPPTEAFLNEQALAATVFSDMAGSDIGRHVAGAGAAAHPHSFRGTLDPGHSLTLFEAKQGGRIAGLRLRPASAFRGKERGILLRFFWDGESEPAVEVPVGDFFGYSFGEPAMRALLAGSAGDTNYVYLPMPFDKSARIELASQEAPAKPVNVEGEVLFAARPRQKNEGRFYALWRRERPTRKGEPFTLLETRGAGHVVGAILQAQGMEPGVTPFFEGDDVAEVDGEIVVHGTGSEDFFNGGWYDIPGRWDRRTSLPFSGCLDYKKPMGRTGGYRFLLGDAYPYRKSIRLTIEHGPTNNAVPTDYASTTFFYSMERPTTSLAAPAPRYRRVADPDTVIFAPGWNVPIDSFSFEDASLAKETEKIDGKRVAYLSLKAGPKEKDRFGPHSVGLLFDLPGESSYLVSIEAMRGPEQGIVQVASEAGPIGEPVDLYAPRRGVSGPLPLGTALLREGNNTLFFRLTGKNPHSGGLRLDLVRIVFQPGMYREPAIRRLPERQ